MICDSLRLMCSQQQEQFLGIQYFMNEQGQHPVGWHRKLSKITEVICLGRRLMCGVLAVLP